MLDSIRTYKVTFDKIEGVERPHVAETVTDQRAYFEDDTGYIWNDSGVQEGFNGYLDFSDEVSIQKGDRIKTIKDKKGNVVFPLGNDGSAVVKKVFFRAMGGVEVFF